jgi:hypothetical protein
MIKLSRPAAPPELDATRIAELTNIYDLDRDKSPWNARYIRDPLLRMSHGKCAYCEARIDEESKYMEVDHYYCKSIYPLRVVEWENLLPSCKRCNVNKGAYDVISDGDIIDPSVDTPAQHLRLWNFRLFGLDPKGDRTIEALYLNETGRVVSARVDIGNAIAETFEKLKALADECHLDNTQIRKINRLARGFASMLEEGLPDSEYSATVATSILAHPDYQHVKGSLQTLQRWSNALELLEASMLAAALPV